MKAAVLGCGAVGSRVARRLAEAGLEVVAFDLDPSALAVVEGVEGVSTVREDLSSLEALRKALRSVDVACDCLPGWLGFKAMEAAAEEGVKLASASYTPEDPFRLDEEAGKTGALIVPDCGVAPGLSNILAGRAYAKLDELLELHIRVGGLPSTPSPPLRHVSTWSLHDLLDEYDRPVRLVRDGKLVVVDPLSEVLTVWIEGVGLFEGFYSDGLRTMLRTIKARNMDEVTLRHRGHLASMKALAELGLLTDRRLKVEGRDVEARRLLEGLLSEAWRGFIDDLLVLEVEAVGAKDGERLRLKSLLVKVDPNSSPVVEVTAAVCSAIASMAAHDELRAEGICPPELIGMNEPSYVKFTQRLGEERLRDLEPIRL